MFPTRSLSGATHHFFVYFSFFFLFPCEDQRRCSRRRDLPERVMRKENTYPDVHALIT